MNTAAMQRHADAWGIAIPPDFLEGVARLRAGDEIGFWTILDDAFDIDMLPPGGPVGLVPIGQSPMGDWLCYWLDPFKPGKAPIVMWSPDEQRLTRLGDNFEQFVDRELKSRIEFLLERSGLLDEKSLEALLSGGAPSSADMDENSQSLRSLIAETCQVAERLGHGDRLRAIVTGKDPLEPTRPEVDGDDEKGISDALKQLDELAKDGDGAAAFEGLGFLHLKQDKKQAANWAMKANRCPLVSWPEFTLDKVGSLAKLVRDSGTDVLPTDRLDPLFGFLTTKPAAKPSARFALAKEYIKKKNWAAAAREAHNALCLAQCDRSASSTALADRRQAYATLSEIYAAAGHPLWVRYADAAAQRLDARAPDAT